MCIKQTRPNYSVGSEQDEAEIKYDRLITQKWCRCEKCEKVPTSLKCVSCHEIAAVKAFHLKFKSRISWNTAALEFFTVEFNCVGNHFLEEFFSKMNYFLVLVLTFLK